MKPLDISLALYVIFKMPDMLKRFGYDKEPMWKISEKNIAELEGCLLQPFQTFDGKELYETPEDKSAILFYQIIKGHKLENGNKRTGIILLVAFLSINNFTISISPEEMYDLALYVAESKNKEEALKKLASLFKSKIIRTSWLTNIFLRIKIK